MNKMSEEAACSQTVGTFNAKFSDLTFICVFSLPFRDIAWCLYDICQRQWEYIQLSMSILDIRKLWVEPMPKPWFVQPSVFSSNRCVAIVHIPSRTYWADKLNEILWHPIILRPSPLKHCYLLPFCSDCVGNCFTLELELNLEVGCNREC